MAQVWVRLICHILLTFLARCSRAASSSVVTCYVCVAMLCCHSHTLAFIPYLFTYLHICSILIRNTKWQNSFFSLLLFLEAKYRIVLSVLRLLRSSPTSHEQYRGGKNKWQGFELRQKKHYDHKQEVKHENDVKGVGTGRVLVAAPAVLRTQRKKAHNTQGTKPTTDISAV